jgi:hypothetical protein
VAEHEPKDIPAIEERLMAQIVASDPRVEATCIYLGRQDLQESDPVTFTGVVLDEVRRHPFAPVLATGLHLFLNKVRDTTGTESMITDFTNEWAVLVGRAGLADKFNFVEVGLIFAASGEQGDCFSDEYLACMRDILQGNRQRYNSQALGRINQTAWWSMNELNLKNN